MSLISRESAEGLEDILLEGAKKIESSELSNQKEADILSNPTSNSRSLLMHERRTKEVSDCIPVSSDPCARSSMRLTLKQ